MSRNSTLVAVLLAYINTDKYDLHMDDYSDLLAIKLVGHPRWALAGYDAVFNFQHQRLWLGSPGEGKRIEYDLIPSSSTVGLIVHHFTRGAS